MTLLNVSLWPIKFQQSLHQRVCACVAIFYLLLFSVYLFVCFCILFLPPNVLLIWFPCALPHVCCWSSEVDTSVTLNRPRWHISSEKRRLAEQLLHFLENRKIGQNLKDKKRYITWPALKFLLVWSVKAEMTKGGKMDMGMLVIDVLQVYTLVTAYNTGGNKALPLVLFQLHRQSSCMKLIFSFWRSTAGRHLFRQKSKSP